MIHGVIVVGLLRTHPLLLKIGLEGDRTSIDRNSKIRLLPSPALFPPLGEGRGYGGYKVGTASMFKTIEM